MYFLIGFSFLILLCIFWLRKKKISYFKIILSSSILLYLTPVLIGQYNKYEIEQEMEKFDLDKDGFYSDAEFEINSELEELQKELINDSGSNLFILFGYPICLFYTIIMALIFHFGTKLLNLKL